MPDQIHWLIPALAAALGGTLLLALVYYYLYIRYRQRYLGVWSCAWSVYAFRFVAELIGALSGFSSGAAVASQSVTLFSCILLLSGTYGFLSKPLPRAWVAAGAVGILGMLLAALLNADFLLLTAPAALVTAAGYLRTGWVILRSEQIQGTGKHLAGWAFVAWVVVKLLYPVLGSLGPWAEWWFLATAVLGTGVAVGYLLMYFEASRAELARSEASLRTRALQQEAVARLGQRALEGEDLVDLFNGAVQAVGSTLQVEYCEVLEFLPQENKLVMRATLPGIEELIGKAAIEAGQGSQAGYTLQRREPVVMPDILTETRFTPNYLMQEHGIVSGMSVVIEGREGPFGVLNASATHRRRFAESDINFLKSIANVLAAAIERKQAEEAVLRSEQAAQKSALEEAVMAEIGRIIGSTLNIEEVYDQFAAEVKKILPFDRIAINLIDFGSQTLSNQYVTGLSVEGRQPGDRFPLAGTATAAAVEAGRGILLPALTVQEAEACFPGHLPVRQAGIQATLLAPLISKGRAFGALVLMSARPEIYTERDIPAVESVAAQISGAIAHARLLNELIQTEGSLRSSERAAQRLAQEKAVTAEIGRILGSTLTIEDVYDRFSEEVRKIISFDRITITGILPEKASTQILYTSGPLVPGRGLKEEYPLAGTISERILASKKGVAFAPNTEDELTRSFPTILPMWKAGFRSFLLVPLISRDDVIGALVMSSYAAGKYTPDDVALAENIASQISGAIANARLFADHHRMADALRESEASLRSIFKVAPIGIGVVHNRVLTRVNDRICEMLGYAVEELEGRSARILYPTDEDFEFVGREKYVQIRARGTGSVETRWQRKDGKIIDVLLSSTPLDPSDWSRGVTFTALDITASKQAEQERLRLEDRLRQAQKMEAIGTLAGGIAHDFNNILAAIIGFAELAKIGAQGNGEATANLAEVLKASFRARDLVRQILTFSRQAETEFGPIQIKLIVKEALKLLRASLPSTIQVRQDLASEGLVLGDPTRIHQVVMNLCTNAYQAMHERGGVLEVSLSETDIGAAPPPDLKVLPPGPCLKLRVRDSGPGIDPAIIHRIFDPYFSTKEKGKGTGLGLAVVHGIVKGHRGAIQVSSRLGEGATFDVYFPMAQAAAAATDAVPDDASVGGGERILFVDDEPSIEILGKRMLASLGYEVATCSNALEALELFRLDPSAFDLVVTDMTMPQMTGDRMALEMMRLRPHLPVIICTGFNEQLTPERTLELGIRALLMKPFLKNEAAAVIRQVLDQG